MSVELKGYKEFEKKFKKLADIDKFFDSTVEDVAIATMDNLIKTTSVDALSGLTHTKNLWEFPNKIRNSTYAIDNTNITKQDKIPIATIISDGRKEARPKKAKLLYIPISRKAKNRDKGYGDPIPSDFEFGKDKDYVLAKKSKAVEGTKFIDKATIKSEKDLKKAMEAEIRNKFK